MVEPPRVADVAAKLNVAWLAWLIVNVPAA
jgi:hypothetical protein